MGENVLVKDCLEGQVSFHAGSSDVCDDHVYHILQNFTPS